MFEKDFPEKMSEITAGNIILEKRSLITGHKNGIVAVWNLDNMENYQVIGKLTSKIETISVSKSNRIVVGSNYGDLLVYDFDNLKSPIFLAEATNFTKSRIWRTTWLNNNEFLSTSTYGKITIFKEKSGKWSYTNLSGHNDSIFGVGRSKENEYFSTGDYFGNIIIWLLNNGDYNSIQKLKVIQAIEDFAWYKDEVFSVITKLGTIYLFEKVNNNEWYLVYEINLSKSMGTSITISEDGKYLYASTVREIIQFERETLQTNMIDIKNSIKIIAKENKLYIITLKGVYIRDIEPIKVSSEVIQYKYLKVSLIGHTGVGKTALCSYITTGSHQEYESTFGRRVWDYKPSENYANNRRVLFHDHGGQETALSTFLPFLSDSDVIFILFQQNDVTTYRTALEIYDLLKDSLASSVDVYFIQTHIDQRMDEIDETKLGRLIDLGEVRGNLKVCPTDGRGIDDVLSIVNDEERWNSARTMIRTKYSENVMNLIMDIASEEYEYISYKDIKNIYEEKTGEKISDYHLKFLLKIYSDQGLIDYYPDVYDIIILNDPEYNDLKSKIPIYVMKHNGVVSFKAMVDEFDNSHYMPILDTIYLRYRIAIENMDKRIFHKLLPKERFMPSDHYINYLKDVKTNAIKYDDQKLDNGRIIEALSELNGQCVDLSLYNGLFTWEDNIILYFEIERTGDFFNGYYINIIYRIGGKNELMYQRQEIRFINILNTIFGTPIKIEE